MGLHEWLIITMWKCHSTVYIRIEWKSYSCCALPDEATRYIIHVSVLCRTLYSRNHFLNRIKIPYTDAKSHTFGIVPRKEWRGRGLIIMMTQIGRALALLRAMKFWALGENGGSRRQMNLFKLKFSNWKNCTFCKMNKLNVQLILDIFIFNCSLWFAFGTNITRCSSRKSWI